MSPGQGTVAPHSWVQTARSPKNSVKQTAMSPRQSPAVSHRLPVSCSTGVVLFELFEVVLFAVVLFEFVLFEFVLFESPQPISRQAAVAAM